MLLAMASGVQTKEFPSWVAFSTWKEEEEARTYTCYVQAKGEIVKSEGKCSGLHGSI